jgi:hypothetical protein
MLRPCSGILALDLVLLPHGSGSNNKYSSPKPEWKFTHVDITMWDTLLSTLFPPTPPPPPATVFCTVSSLTNPFRILRPETLLPGKRKGTKIRTYHLRIPRRTFSSKLAPGYEISTTFELYSTSCLLNSPISDEIQSLAFFPLILGGLCASLYITSLSP